MKFPWKEDREENLAETNSAYRTVYLYLEKYLSLDDRIYRTTQINIINGCIEEYIEYQIDTTDLMKTIANLKLSMPEITGMNKLNALDHIRNVGNNIIDGLRKDIEYLQSKKRDIENQRHNTKTLEQGFENLIIGEKTIQLSQSNLAISIVAGASTLVGLLFGVFIF